MPQLRAEIVLQGPSDGSTVESEYLSTSNITENSLHSPRSGTVDDAKYLGRRPKNVKPGALKSRTQPRLLPLCSHIPLPMKPEPIKMPPFIKNVRSSPSRPVSLSASRVNTSLDNRHTLEIQFINKNKRFLQMKRELEEKQKPVMELHKTLVQLKKRLEELGKFVTLEDLKLAPVKQYQKSLKRSESDFENVPREEIQNVRSSLEQIPKTMMDVCMNLLSRRALIVEVLEKVANSELDLSDVSSKIDTLKNEGQTLENSLEQIIKEQQDKINELVAKWESVLSSKQLNIKSEQLQLQPQASHERLMQESKQVIDDLQKKMDDRKAAYDKSIAELNGNVRTLREQIQKLELDLEYERKATKDIKSRNTVNAKNSKTLKDKINELENDKITLNEANVDLERKNKILHEQLKNKEAQWNKEKEEMNKAFKQQEGILKNIASEKADYETTLESMENQKINTEEELQNKIEYLENKVVKLSHQCEENAKQRDVAQEKCAEFETLIARMGIENKETMNKACENLKISKCVASEEAEHLRKDMAKDLELRELTDKVSYLERERLILFQEKRKLEEQAKHKPNEVEKEIYKQQKYIYKYKLLLEESEKRLMQKCNEVSLLQSEMQQLKVRQESLEEQNMKCPTHEMKEIVEKGRYKLNALMKKTIENEQKLEQYAEMLEEKDRQINNMESLLKYRDHITNLMKAAQDEVVFEKISLTKYSTELRQNLSHVLKEGKTRERLIKELHDKIEIRERQIAKLEKEIRQLETNLIICNDKKFKLQEMIEGLEKELHSTKANVNQLADINFRSGRKKYKPF